jgi:TatD DNase family protein
VTFPKATALREAARLVPDEKLLVETDSPYLAPVPMRGKRNEPAFVAHVVTALAALRGTSPASLGALVSGNFDRLFHS